MKLRAEGRTYSSETFNRKKRKAAGKADGQHGGRPKKKVKVKSSQRNKAPYNVRSSTPQRHTAQHTTAQGTTQTAVAPAVQVPLSLACNSLFLSLPSPIPFSPLPRPPPHPHR
jgi:hypothetical protein